MESFHEICTRIGRTDKHTAHTYTEWYDYWFAPLRDKPVKVLEIGVSVFGGGSLLGLAEYFQQGMIFGIDIDLSRLVRECCTARIMLNEQDAYDINAVEYFLSWCGTFLKKPPEFDIIIDDACHDSDKQRLLFQRFAPLLSPGGIYVCEDTAWGTWKGPSVQAMVETAGFDLAIVDQSHGPKYDNVLARMVRRTKG